MDMNTLNKYRQEKDHQERYGHLSEKDRNDIAYHRNGFEYKTARDYHSPNNGGGDMNAHGSEMQ